MSVLADDKGGKGWGRDMVPYPPEAPVTRARRPLISLSTFAISYTCYVMCQVHDRRVLGGVDLR